MNLSRSEGSLTFGYSEQMYFMDFMQSIDDMKAYVEFLENHELLDIDNDDGESFSIDLDDTQSFWHNNDGDLIMCLSGIAYETRCYAYFGIIRNPSFLNPRVLHRDVALLQVCDSSTDRPYYDREE
tara:strand:+ start:198 stop:575 length:378 start_codon:yes stop_codon:yes gene_type:complete